MPSRIVTSGRTPCGRARPPNGLASFAPTHAIVPPTARLAARRLRPARSARTETAGTVPNVPACMTARTGTRIRSLAPLTVRKSRSS